MRPLEGVRVLAIEQMQSLPYATQVLARLGADVVKVEPPVTGESARQSLPAMVDAEGRKVGNTYLRNNLGKRSITVDLKAPEGRQLILDMVPNYDVVCQNFKAGTIERLGLGYDDIVKVHPSVIYLSVSGFGTRGESPYSDWPAYAPIAEAMAGLYTWKPRPGQAPVASPFGAMGDTGSGVWAALGVVTALYHRTRTGEGQHVDIAMLDAMVAFNDAGVNYYSMGMADGGNAPLINHSFATSDGWFVMQVGRRHHFELLAKAIGKEEWLGDDRLAAAPGWFAHLDDVIRPGVEAWSRQRTKMEVCQILGKVGVAVGPVHTAAEVIADPHVHAHHMIVEIPRTDGVADPVLAIGNPIKLSKVPEADGERIPLLGEHTDQVLRRDLATSDERLADLHARGIIGESGRPAKEIT